MGINIIERLFRDIERYYVRAVIATYISVLSIVVFYRYLTPDTSGPSLA